ncbi:hypothetical protein ACFOJE_20810 [Azotobacter bryophylli]|uniref:Uncharacterized protein n=1 Tax=Azotobacter bryophylli TaxID=1986537 RepID=A0ABV7B1L4_9GAMM
MARRRNPDSLSHILLRITLAAGFGLFMWFVVAKVITRTFTTMQEDMLARNRAAQTQVQAKMKEAQAQKPAQPHTIQQSQTMSPYEAQRAAEIEAQRTADLQRQIEQQRLKDAAWERFYIPPEACKHPESPTRFDVCSSREARFRKDFERRWADGEFAQPNA